MKWTEGRSKGATSLVKRSAIKSGTIAIREKGSVVWGKSKKTYNAEVVDDGSGFDVPQQATRVAAGEDEPLTLELVDPAPEESQQSPHRDRQPALITMVESLVDAVARLEAKVTVQYDQLVTRLAQLQADIDKLRVCEVYTAEESCPAGGDFTDASTPWNQDEFAVFSSGRFEQKCFYWGCRRRQFRDATDAVSATTRYFQQVLAEASF